MAASSPGDCAFEDDECGWSNPERRDNVDELNWERSTATEGGRRVAKIPGTNVVFSLNNWQVESEKYRERQHTLSGSEQTAALINV